jgi:hypothetical protein
MGRDVAFVFILALFSIWHSPVNSETADLEVSERISPIYYDFSFSSGPVCLMRLYSFVYRVIAKVGSRILRVFNFLRCEKEYLGRALETLKMFQKCYTPDGGYSRHARIQTRQRTMTFTV